MVLFVKLDRMYQYSNNKILRKYLYIFEENFKSYFVSLGKLTATFSEFLACIMAVGTAISVARSDTIDVK